MTRSPILLAALIAAPAGAQEAVRFKLACETAYDHGSDPDRVSPERERELLQVALSDTYPLLEAKLQETARRVTFMVLHKGEDTKIYMGWSAEDDLDYQYPDTRFYGETYVDANGRKGQGTIKVNFTEKFVRTLDLGLKLGEKDPAVRRGIRGFWRQVIAHELTHAWQYHTAPVRDLYLAKDPAPGGLADLQLLDETKRKVAYERQAYGVGRRFGKGFEKDILALADAIEALSKSEPKLFEKGGPYRLLALDAANPVVKRYLRDETEYIAFGEEFTPKARVIYEGQYAPAEAVRWVHAINGYKEAMRAHELAKGLTGVQPRDFSAEMAELRRVWASYMEAGPISETLVESYPYLKLVKERYAVETGRYEALRKRD